MTIYSTLFLRQHMVKNKEERIHLTAGAREFMGTIAKPAALTATAWNNPAAKRVLRDISLMTELPISKSMKKNQSIDLEYYQSLVFCKAVRRNRHT